MRWMRWTAGTIVLGAALFAVFSSGTGTAQVTGLTPREELGKRLFFDTNLSTPPGQSCAACHGPEVGFTGPISAINAGGAAYPGAVHTRFGGRKPPASAYAGDSPVFYWSPEEALWIGGMFWDGRATGWTLGDPLAEQALGPFLNPLEQNNPDARSVCLKVMKSSYAHLFYSAWGPNALDCVYDVAGTYERIGRSIAAYERSAEVNPFASRYDLYVNRMDRLTHEEKRGLKLFEGKAKCALCHVPPLFTDFTYDNLGLPKNPANPFYAMPPEFNPDGAAWVDVGLGGFLKGEGYGPEVTMPEMGKFKVPTLRNVDKRPHADFVKAFGHNGYFKSLDAIVHFYNTRDVLPHCEALMEPVEGVNCWPAPEYPENVNTDELGNLGLTFEEERQVVAFMKALSDIRMRR